MPAPLRWIWPWPRLFPRECWPGGRGVRHNAEFIFRYFTCAWRWACWPRAPLRRFWLPGVLLFCVSALPWFFAVQLRNPQFFREFILEHNLARFSSNLYHHPEPFWYYLPVTVLALVPWIVFVIAAFAESELHTTVQYSGPLSVVDAVLADHAEAVVKEAVSNAVRHADASQLTIHIDVADGLSIDVIDNGKGIPDEITASGLANLRQRAQQANGTFTIQAVPEGGTRLRWSAPLP